MSSLARYQVPRKTQLTNHAYTHDKHLGRDSAFVLGGRKRERACMAGKMALNPEKKFFVFIYFGWRDDYVTYYLAAS